MSQDFQPGDFLIFQLESGFAPLRVLAIEKSEGGTVWHLAGYSDFFPDVDTAEKVVKDLTPSEPHLALTDRAFESTQVAKIGHEPITENDLAAYENWKSTGRAVSDRSVRLMLGLR